MAISFPKTILALYTLIITCSFCPTNAQINISTPCTSSMIQTFMPCLSYVTGSSSTGSSPTQDCCDSLKALMAKGVECGCLIVTGNVPISTIPFVNRNLAISLPRMCQSSVPVQCKASGDRLPAPGPVLLGPTSAPTTSSTAHTQSPTAVAAPSPAEMGILRVEGGECLEGLPTVDVTCRGSQADQVCWIACQQRHGPRAEAWCREGPGLPGSVACMCSYPC
ncbi:Bifunctional inhibitor/lipid-transfer protein/seed storage 2S albumin superfamily protein [Striga hermonthica]|uniref:Bifunctional inhibitor/lipid-transfer protein/seed storage 2S albumin superfamily protein n=1 Tax=Striga hermonthica TaxID=68872 RepID=A0A9N7NFX8_STRHE|nr:Bifunctional inhibitor/lipid-transfer protein/seed storage 2S albumin superfamily protein [Striga hermonthica]